MGETAGMWAGCPKAGIRLQPETGSGGSSVSEFELARLRRAPVSVPNAGMNGDFGMTHYDSPASSPLEWGVTDLGSRSVSYPPLKGVGFLLPRPGSIPAHPGRRPPSARPFPQTTPGRRVTEALVSTGVTSACPVPSEGFIS